MKNKRLLPLLFSGLLFYACQVQEVSTPVAEVEKEFTPYQVTFHDGRPFSTGKDYSDPKGKYVAGPGGPVMMQAFYWDVPAGGTWWDNVASKIPDWSNANIASVWLPPASKGQGGGFTMGYDPFDYYDFGEYNQQGSLETRFGSRNELENVITVAHAEDMEVYADMVLNHNSGGDLEWNEFANTDTWTDFNPASGLFFRSKLDFHPNDFHANDAGSFGGFPDLCHDKTYVQDWLWNLPNSVGKYYHDVMGFDGWRFDYVKGFDAWVVNSWNSNVGGFSVGEYWDGNAVTLNNWAQAANSSVFDFALYYRMLDAFSQNDLNNLNSNDMMWKKDPFKAVTFVANHDEDNIFDGKNLAYAYILTHEGYPCIFYRDYEEWLDKDDLDDLIYIHKWRATGNTSILYVDNDEYIARRNGWNGNSGLIVYINNSDQPQQHTVQTNWGAGTKVMDFTFNSGWWCTTNANGEITINVPPNGYTIWCPWPVLTAAPANTPTMDDNYPYPKDHEPGYDNGIITLGNPINFIKSTEIQLTNVSNENHGVPVKIVNGSTLNVSRVLLDEPGSQYVLTIKEVNPRNGYNDKTYYIFNN